MGIEEDEARGRVPACRLPGPWSCGRQTQPCCGTRSRLPARTPLISSSSVSVRSRACVRCDCKIPLVASSGARARDIYRRSDWDEKWPESPVRPTLRLRAAYAGLRTSPRSWAAAVLFSRILEGSPLVLVDGPQNINLTGQRIWNLTVNTFIIYLF